MTEAGAENKRGDGFMKLYIDFDDCLCETGRYFSGLAARLFGKDVPYEQVRYFDLQKSFSLTDEEFRLLMAEAHRPEVLLSYAETPGASETVNAWLEAGHDVSVITGRPFLSWEPSRAWLDAHQLSRVKLFCLNKYGRESLMGKTEYSLEMEDYRRMRFDFAVEDSPAAFRFFGHLPNLKVLVYDRPWNRDCAFPGDNFTRCASWEEIRRLVR